MTVFQIVYIGTCPSEMAAKSCDLTPLDFFSCGTMSKMRSMPTNPIPFMSSKTKTENTRVIGGNEFVIKFFVF